MSGLDEILNIIDSNQKEQEESIIKSAESRVREIQEDAAAKAEKAYADYMKTAAEKNEREYENSCSSIDAAMKRKILEFKVEQVDIAIEKALKKLRGLPVQEYFELLKRLISRSIRKGEGVVSLSKKDLGRMPDGFEKEIKTLAETKGAAIKLSREPADIEDGFILSYGNISENCSFSAIIESEREGVRDTAAKELFG